MTKINLFKNSNDAYTVDAGAVLFTQGDRGDSMYAIVDGEVELTRDGETLEIVTEGGIVGELALIDDSPRAATARAKPATKVVRVDKESFTFLVQEHPTFALMVMATMAERMRAARP